MRELKAAFRTLFLSFTLSIVAFSAFAERGQQFAQFCIAARTWSESYTCPRGAVKSVSCQQCSVPPGSSGG
jgi:hypothetical protein